MTWPLLGFTALLEAGGLYVTVPLLAIAIATGAILMERLSYFGWGLLDSILPVLRRQRAAEQHRFAAAFTAHLRQQDEESRRALAQHVDRAPPALRRLVAPLLSGPELRPGPFAELRIRASEHLARREVRRAVGLLAPFAVAALLLGLLAGLGALERSLDLSAVHGMSAFAAGSPGAQRTLVAAEAALVVAGFAIVASFVLKERAASLDREMLEASLRWRRALRSGGELPEVRS